MKHLLLFAFFLSILTLGFSQNIQLHYDFGEARDGKMKKNRKYFTTTLEMFKPDSMGTTFWFVDMDYDDRENGMSFAYWEIVRTLKIPKIKFMELAFSYNDGMFIDHAWLAGISIPIKIGKYTISTSYYYRAEKNAKSADFQFTGVWHFPLFNNKATFCGFVDLWTSDDYNNQGKRDGKRAVFLTEPQLWFKLNSHFAVGGEVEISKNFFTFDDDIEVMPTVGAKWEF